MPASKRPTIADVARLAQVSEATVSGILNNSPLQAPETAFRVRKAMHELGYTPRRNKLRLENRRNQKAGTVALLAPDRNIAAMGTELFSQLAAGAERELFDHGYHLLPCHLEEDGSLPDVFRCKRMINGVILRCGWSGITPEQIRQNEEILHTFPMVSTFSSDLSVGDGVGVDNVSCSQWAADQLALLKPERIFCLKPEPKNTNADLHIRSSMFEFILNSRNEQCETCTVPANGKLELPGWSPEIPAVLFTVGHDSEVVAAAEFLSRQPHRSTLFAVMTGELPEILRRDFIHTIHIDPYRIGMAAAEMLCHRITHPYDLGRRLLIPPRELQLAPVPEHAG